MNEVQDLRALCEERGVKIVAMPRGEELRVGCTMRVWWCDLHYQGRSIQVPFYQGMGHKNPPTAADVLLCLITDAECYDNATDLDDFAQDYCVGMKVSRVLAMYEACRKMSADIRVFLGDDFDMFQSAAANY